MRIPLQVLLGLCGVSLCSLALLHLAAAAPVAGDVGGLEVQSDAPDPLVIEALLLLDAVPIKRTVEKLVARKQIEADMLPVPAQLPAGSVELELSDKQLRLTDSLTAKATWSTTVPKSLDGQFVYHMHLTRCLGDEYADGHSTWGVAMSEFNGNVYGTMINAPPRKTGPHRLLGILSAWSIKTEETHVLDVAEVAYVVTEP